MEKVENPSDEQIDNLHKLYMEKLTELFEKHKLDCGKKEEDHLTIV